MYDNPLKLHGFHHSFSFSRSKIIQVICWFFSVSTTGLFSSLLPLSLSSAPMAHSKTPKNRFKQTIISPIVPDSFGVAVVPPGLGTAPPEVSVVTGSPSAVGAPHSPRPALTDTVNANIDAMLRCLPIVSTTASIVTNFPRSRPVATTVAPGCGDASGTHHSTMPDCRPTLYKSPLPIQGREYSHSNPPNDAANSNFEVSKPTIATIGCQNSTTLLLQATADLLNLSTYKLCRLMSGNALLPLVRFSVFKPSRSLGPWYHPARGYMENPRGALYEGFKVATHPELPPAALMAQSAVLHLVPSTDLE